MILSIRIKELLLVSEFLGDNVINVMTEGIYRVDILLGLLNCIE